jgi:hypothetical protein
MGAFSDSYVLRVLLATPAPAGRFDTIARRWRWLSTSLADQYRPELYYMRGPGPKWREKHARGRGLVEPARPSLVHFRGSTKTAEERYQTAAGVPADRCGGHQRPSRLALA